MAHFEKFTRAVVGHMSAHYDRRGHNIGNKNIDPSRTPLNYNIGPERNISQGDFIRQRCKEVKSLNRKDVNVMCDWVLTAPKDLPPEEYRRFFESGYQFMSTRYGAENVVSAYVHMDEITPHMHFAFVPVFRDSKKGIDRLSAKDVVTRKDLQTFHRDLSRHMELVFGRDIGVANGVVKENGGNLSIRQLQSITERAEAEAAKIIGEAPIERDRAIAARDTAAQETSRIAAERLKLQTEVESAQQEKNALEGELRNLTAQKSLWSSSLNSDSKIADVGQIITPVFGSPYFKCSPDEINELKKAAQGNLEFAYRAQTAEKNLLKLEKSIKANMISRSDHKKMVAEMKKELESKYLGEIWTLKKESEEKTAMATQHIKFINEKGLTNEYKAWLDANRQQERSRSQGMER